jgi:hypothetical protein
MAATILSSPRAIEMSVYVVRALVQLREMLASNRELARRFAQLETRLDKKLTPISSFASHWHMSLPSFSSQPSGGPCARQ